MVAYFPLIQLRAHSSRYYQEVLLRFLPKKRCCSRNIPPEPQWGLHQIVEPRPRLPFRLRSGFQSEPQSGHFFQGP